ncbi:helix-turn-helix domain-containing protein [uncultured Fusobacterium sp.]|uniref:helix-turn-helix domain-containing protein n=1 Tax=uncultured Fusobacterium sp. TaxID=159267 RepID=UPI00262E22EB|nr:helix-turn-helix domain-containing protein [uncultured Fusobacterium sp.]
MKTEQELEITRFKIIEPFLKKEKKLKEIELEENISYSTLKRWVNAYKKNGMLGLEKKEREDKNSFRNIDEDSLEKIKNICKESGETNITKLYSDCKDSFPETFSISYATFYRIVNNIDEFFNKTTVKYMEKIKKENQCYLVFDIPLYILVDDFFSNKKVVPRLLIMLDSASLEPINFAIDYYFSNFYSLLGFIREGILKVSIKHNKFTIPKEILVASKNINNKKILKEIYNKLGIKISEHYTENSEVYKFIEFIKNDIEDFYKRNNYELTLVKLTEFLSNYIYLQKKEFAFSINYNIINSIKYIRQLDIFLQLTTRKITDSKVRVKNFQYISSILKGLNGQDILIKFSPINPNIIYLFTSTAYLGFANLNFDISK